MDSKQAAPPFDPLEARRALDENDTPAARESMKEIQRRVIAATASPKPPAVDHWTGKKLCHRYFSFVQTERPNPMKLNEIQVMSNLVNVGCIGAKCSLWDDENKRCLDVTEKLAQVETSKTLESLDGLMRMLHDGGN